MNLITIHRWKGTPQWLVAEFSRPGRPRFWLWSSSVGDAVREVAGLAGLDAEFRDAHGEEWDILVPETTLCHEFPDREIGDDVVFTRRLAKIPAERQVLCSKQCGTVRPVPANP